MSSRQRILQTAIILAPILALLLALPGRAWQDGPVAKHVEVPLGGGKVLKMVRIEAGKFVMGSPRSEQDLIGKIYSGAAGNSVVWEKQHDVAITKAFYMGVYEVTRGQFAEFVRQEDFLTESELTHLKWFDSSKPKNTWRNPGFDQDDNHPVVCVSWHDAVAFCRWLSRKTGKFFDLPTEAEWEYAARAGTQTMFHSGDTFESFEGFGNRADQVLKAQFAKDKITHRHGDFALWRDGYAFTAPVGSYRPNGFGLYDMHGNAWEWVKDRYKFDLYLIDSVVNDPLGPVGGDNRVCRGGSWASNADMCRCAARRNFGPGYCSGESGFRVVLR